MKMTTTLNVQESGRVKYVRRPGAVLEAGCLVARLELDDPSKVRPVCDTRHSYSVSRTGWWLLALEPHPPRWAQERACLWPHPPQHPTKSKTHVLPMIFRVPRGCVPLSSLASPPASLSPLITRPELLPLRASSLCPEEPSPRCAQGSSSHFL